MNECIDPQLIQEGALLAFVEGEADSQVRAHVENCPACASKVRELQEMSQILQTGLYRIACPSPVELMKFQDGAPSPADRLIIAAHLRSCPLCPTELAEMIATEESNTNLISYFFRNALSVIQASLISPPRIAVRSRGQEMQIGLSSGGVAARGGTAPLLYQAEGVTILIGFQPATANQPAGSLIGTAGPVVKAAGREVWLFQEGTELKSTITNHLGDFAFEGINPGTMTWLWSTTRKPSGFAGSSWLARPNREQDAPVDVETLAAAYITVPEDQIQSFLAGHRPELSPDFLAALEHMADHLRLENPRQELHIVERMLRASDFLGGEGRANALWLKANLLVRLGRYKRASLCIKKRLRSAPGKATRWRWRACRLAGWRLSRTWPATAKPCSLPRLPGRCWSATPAGIGWPTWK